MSTETETGNAYELLSKPTLTLTDEEITAICADLRQRRERFLQGSPDKGAAKPKKAAVSQTAEAKKERSEALLGDIGNLF